MERNNEEDSVMMSLCAVSYAAPVKASDEAAAEQLKLITASFDSCRQDESAGSWSYTVTDLNHNGRLELFAATIDDMGRHTFRVSSITMRAIPEM